ncbi:hypothetical protein, partial [Vibrio parahaemolyticus]
WYDGSKKWGIASDLTFIVERLNRLSYENQKIASEQYDDIFKFHINKGEVTLARKNANTMLNDFANEFGISKSDYQNIKAANDDQVHIDAAIERLKALQKRAKPHISFEKRSRKQSAEIYTSFMGDELEITVDFYDLGEDGLEIVSVRITDYKAEEIIDITPMIVAIGGKVLKLLKEARDADR